MLCIYHINTRFLIKMFSVTFTCTISYFLKEGGNAPDPATYCLRPADDRTEDSDTAEKEVSVSVTAVINAPD